MTVRRGPAVGLFVLGSLLGFLAVAVVSLAQDGRALPLLAGTYVVEGRGPLGPYRGAVEVSQRNRAVFLRWRLEGGEEFAGLGLVTPPLVAASYRLDDIGAVVLYRLDADVWRGEWPDADGVVHTETLRKAAPQAER